MVDVTLNMMHYPVGLEIGQWGGQGYSPNTSRVVQATGSTSKVLAEKLNLPTSLVRSGISTYYVNSLAEGKIYKLMYAC